MRRPAVGVCTILVLVTSCSNAVVTPPSTAAPTSPIVTVAPFPGFEITWEPADDIEQVQARVEAELARGDATMLLPVDLPQAVDGSVARLTIYGTVRADLVSVVVYVSFQRDGGDLGLSLTSMPAAETSLTCEGRVGGQAAGGLSNWGVLEIRSSPGCAATNEVGLTFIEWEEGESWYHVETHLAPDDALSWLDSWRTFR
jgi:hypothetical protein